MPSDSLSVSDRFSAWISMSQKRHPIKDSKQLECYAPQHSEDGKEVSCWVASEEGKRFSVHWKDCDTRRTHTSVNVYLDGIDVYGYYFRMPKKNAPQEESTLTEDIDCTKESGRSFLFSKIRVTDNEELVTSKRQVSQIGEIQIVIKAAKLISWRSLGGRPVKRKHKNSDSGTLNTEKIHEKSKKCCAHKITYGSRSQTKSTGGRATHKCEEGETLATFIFRYTSKDILQAKGIVPRPPTPPPVEPEPSDQAPAPLPEEEEEMEEEITDDDDDEGSDYEQEEPETDDEVDMLENDDPPVQMDMPTTRAAARRNALVGVKPEENDSKDGLNIANLNRLQNSVMKRKLSESPSLGDMEGERVKRIKQDPSVEEALMMQNLNLEPGVTTGTEAEDRPAQSAMQESPPVVKTEVKSAQDAVKQEPEDNKMEPVVIDLTNDEEPPPRVKIEIDLTLDDD